LLKQRLLPNIRTDAGGLSGFGQRDGSQLDNLKGRLARMLPPKRPTAEGRELARAMLAVTAATEERLRGNAERN
jgi:hypothetical protein